MYYNEFNKRGLRWLVVMAHNTESMFGDLRIDVSVYLYYCMAGKPLIYAGINECVYWSGLEILLCLSATTLHEAK